MLFSYRWLQEYVAKPLPALEELAGLLNMHAFEIEGVAKKGGDALLDVKVLPNRPDAMSHVGMAREIAAIMRSSVRHPKKKLWGTGSRALPALRVRVRPAGVAKRYSALVLKDIAIGPSPLWMRERLEALGINSINNVVDITNYVMAELGQPLHAFDFDRVKNHTMLVRPSAQGERVMTLDERTFELPEGSIVIEDDGRLIDLAGIKGGALSGITNGTKNIILEAAVFDGTRIYKTKKALQYTTAAADLFSHHLNPWGTKEALERAYALLEESSGGVVVQYVDIYQKPRLPKRITFSSRLFFDMFSVHIPVSVAQTILTAMGFGIKTRRAKDKETVFTVTPPAWRNDCETAEDVLEEVGRIYGYERVPALMPCVPLSMPKENLLLRAQEAVSDALVSEGFSETLTYSFVGKKEFETFSYAQETRRSLVEILNPSNEQYTHLRCTLLERLASAVELNRPLFAQQPLELFEIGDTFYKDQDPKEYSMVAAMTYDPALKKNAGFYRLKGVLERLLSSLGIESLRYEALGEAGQKEHIRAKEFWHPAKTALVRSGTTLLGVVGELHPSVRAALSLPSPLYAFECDMNALTGLATRERSYLPPLQTPGITLDIALVVPNRTPADSVKKEVERAGGGILVKTEIFDVYEGRELPKGRKSVAVHMFFHGGKRTLTADEAKEAALAVERAVREKGWTVRT